MATPLIQWYPGHIAKAERALQQQLRHVDVVLEMRDARIPLASHHPKMKQWVGQKQHVLILNRVDTISDGVQQAWQRWFKERGEQPFFTNAQKGEGVMAVAKAAQQAGIAVNQRRRDRGMAPRPVRAVVLGFPNVGKSALINRLLKRRVVNSEARPGVTRQLRWVRVSPSLELLDTPGVLPANLTDQTAAAKLAMCDDIGQAAYDDYLIAAALVNCLIQLNHASALGDRYRVPLGDDNGEAYVYRLSEERFHGRLEQASRQILQDFRKGILGAIALEMPPIEASLPRASSLSPEIPEIITPQ
ncbi:ribosome biogenesis GTPase YlqF [Candidatus Synechococcus calcipolaris G9]|uniref:Ribosome biogenesis GTPase A n=1 Tax=Candidatus Synechococcus calcipolaris G9 TaxID=1497997 RepID=A0ABT6EWE0_9SYNE|nr:ribosome biogenesis GTPase YlqF [Candidatus Synechococcus calcipolaris]MDG2990099.1 ribosome biogenesis GTPase YlqF [Candidatus Synechococcus calcipolaris G9]